MNFLNVQAAGSGSDDIRVLGMWVGGCFLWQEGGTLVSSLDGWGFSQICSLLLTRKSRQIHEDQIHYNTLLFLCVTRELIPETVTANSLQSLEYLSHGKLAGFKWLNASAKSWPLHMNQYICSTVGKSVANSMTCTVTYRPTLEQRTFPITLQA